MNHYKLTNENYNNKPGEGIAHKAGRRLLSDQEKQKEGRAY